MDGGAGQIPSDQFFWRFSISAAGGQQENLATDLTASRVWYPVHGGVMRRSWPLNPNSGPAKKTSLESGFEVPDWCGLSDSLSVLAEGLTVPKNCFQGESIHAHCPRNRLPPVEEQRQPARVGRSVYAN